MKATVEPPLYATELDQAETPAQLPPGVGVGIAVVEEVAGRVVEDDGTGVLLEEDGGSDAPPQALTVGKIFSAQGGYGINIELRTRAPIPICILCWLRSRPPLGLQVYRCYQLGSERFERIKLNLPAKYIYGVAK